MVELLERKDYDSLMAEINSLKQQVVTQNKQLADALNTLSDRVKTLETSR